MLDSIVLNKDGRSVTLVYTDRPVKQVSADSLEQVLNLLTSTLDWSAYFEAAERYEEITQVIFKEVA